MSTRAPTYRLMCPRVGFSDFSVLVCSRTKCENMRESKIEKHLVEEVEKLGGWAIKFVPTFAAGFPDRIVLLPRGRIFFIELKAPGQKARPLQILIHKKLSRLGFEVLVLDSIHSVNQFICNL